MLDKETFCENEILKGTDYATGFAVGSFEATCLCIMRTLCNEKIVIEKVARVLEWTVEEIKIAQELYVGMMTILRYWEVLFRDTDRNPCIRRSM